MNHLREVPHFLPRRIVQIFARWVAGPWRNRAVALTTVTLVLTVRADQASAQPVAAQQMAAKQAPAQPAASVRVEQRNLHWSLRTGLTGEEVFLGNDSTASNGPKSTKETREVNCGSAHCYLVVMTTVAPRGTMSDSVWMDHQTLAMVRHVEVGFGIHTEVNVLNGRIRGTALDSTKAPRIIDEAAPAFDFSVIDEIATGLPFKPGYAASIHTFDVTQGFRDVGLSVLGEEKLDTPAGTRDSWRVEFSFGTHKTVRWFDKQTREGLKWQVDMGNGRVMWGRTKR